jgi:hypothetical protein
MYRPDHEFWMVWNPEGRAPVVPHDRAESATREAERLARHHKGQRFYVLRGVTFFEHNDIRRVDLTPDDDGIPF